MYLRTYEDVDRFLRFLMVCGVSCGGWCGGFVIVYTSVEVVLIDVKPQLWFENILNGLKFEMKLKIKK